MVGTYHKDRIKKVGGKIRKLIGIALLLCIGLGLVLFLYVSTRSSSPLSRLTYVVVANPVVVISFNKRTNEELSVVLANETVITAADGYGAYALGSLIRLGQIDNLGPRLLTRSLEHALGVPIDGSITLPESQPFSLRDDTPIRNQIFSWSLLFSHLRKSSIYSMPLGDVIQQILLRYFGKTPLVRVIELSDTAVVTDQVEPDGSKRLAFDSSRFDQIYSGIYEDIGVRKERLRLGIVNATGVSGLGTSLARLLSHIGYNVVTVTGQPSDRDTCLVEVTPDQEKSKTATFLKEHYSCELQTIADLGQVSIRFTIGKEVARQFQGKISQ